MRLYIVRHGETDWNRLRRLQGRSDIPLNENGIKLAEVTGEGLAEVPFDLCIAGPLVRTRQTALCILKRSRAFSRKRQDAEHAGMEDFHDIGTFLAKLHEKPQSGAASFEQTTEISAYGGFPLLSDESITEMNFGSWEGLGCGPENMEITEPSFRNFFIDPAKVAFPEGAENLQLVKERTAGFLERLCAEPAFADKTILIASHGFAIRAMLNPFYDDPADFWQGHAPYNCAVNVLETDADGKLQLVVRDKIYYDQRLAATYTGKHR